jgi:hypothetical protein
VIHQHVRNKKTRDSVHVTGNQESTLRNIHNTAQIIKSSSENVTSSSATRLLKTRAEIMETVEKLLSSWIQNEPKRKLCANLATIRERV